MAHLEQEPFFTMVKAWDSDDYLPTKIKFSKTTTTGRTIKGEVTPDDGEKTIEFTIDCTVAEFDEVRKDFQWGNNELFASFRKCLTGQARTTWDETIDDHYPSDDDKHTANFEKALPKFYGKLLNCDKARDVHYRFLEYKATKDPFMGCNSHLRRWKEYFRISRKLPQGIKQDPSEDEIKLWYFRTYCKPHRTNYLAARNLDKDTMQDITEFMRLQHDKDRDSGKLARLKTNKDRVDKDRLGRVSGKRARGDERRDKQYRSNYGRDDRSAKSSNSRSSYSDGKDRKYSRSGDYKRSSKSYNRQDKTRSSDFFRKDKRDCPKHQPCEHTWEDCFNNPHRKKKGESHYQDDNASSKGSGSDTTSSHESDSSQEEENHFQQSEEEGEVPMKSMQDKIPKKKKAKKGKLAKKRCKGKRKAARRILDDTSDEDDFANSNNE
jgi:hypothetical protein